MIPTWNRAPETLRSPGDAPTTVLVVAMGNSVHTLNWLKAARNERLRLVLLPTVLEPVLNAEDFVPVNCAAHVKRLLAQEIGLWTPEVHDHLDPQDALPPPLAFSHRQCLRQSAAIIRAVRALRPQLLHSMELQVAGYTCLAAARELRDEFPRWLVSNWGSDLVLYAKLRDHRPVLQELMATADAYISECCRDSSVARQLGFGGILLSSLPASGGINLDGLFDTVPPSMRKEILVKGNHGWSGRGLHILSALHLAGRKLQDFHIRVVHGSSAMADMVNRLNEEDGLHVIIDPHLPQNEQALRRLANARVSISLGISGGIDTTMLESMSLGTFPIVPNATCASEWIESGRDGFIVDPHDIAALARAIVESVTDDRLVDVAAIRNRATVCERWNAEVNRTIIQKHYEAAIGLRSEDIAREDA